MSSIEKPKVSNLEGESSNKNSPNSNPIDLSPPKKIPSPHSPDHDFNCEKEIREKYKGEIKLLGQKRTNEIIEFLCSVEVMDVKKRMAKYHFKRINDHGIEQQFHSYKMILNQIKNTGTSNVFDQEQYPSDESEISKKKETKIAIIIPFRDSEQSKQRTKQLEILTDYMRTFLDGESYKIFVIEQTEDGNKFNRGQLLNIGFEIANKEGYNNFIFHDVDLLPSSELKKYYTNIPIDEPVHIAAAWDRYNKNPSYFGGIVAFNKDMFNKINGYPNNFWGWGGEDDELYKRTKKFFNVKKVHEGSIKDLENLSLEEKLDYLRENELKFMEKKEALAEHEATWKNNGLNSLSYRIIKTKSCGIKCEVVGVELGSGLKSTEIPQELFVEEIIEEAVEEQPKKITSPEAFNNLVNTFYSLNLFRDEYKKGIKKFNELEVRFGTKQIRPLTKNDYDNVVKLLKSFGFVTNNPLGIPSLRVRCEFLDSVTGKVKMSDIRTEIDSIIGVETYCKTNDIKEVYKRSGGSNLIFSHKRPFITQDKKILRPVDMDDFNFRVSLQTEETASKGMENYIIENWRKSKKEFRYLNRVTFHHDSFPVNIDLSIVKSGNRGKDKFGRSYIIPVYTVEESNVFNNQETYEIEIEINNKLIGPGTKFATPDLLLISLRKVIKYILSGLQGTLYPISYPEQEEVLRNYMKMVWKDEYEPSVRVTSKNFIGPNSITLQLTNIAPLDENSVIPNIRKDFVVTDKADGERHLMYISNVGKIYLISTNMDVKFTGAKTISEECFNTLFDGELIAHDKKGRFINLYAAFDIYFHRNKDIRNYTFMLRQEEEDVYKSRFYLLNKLKTMVKPISILSDTTSTTVAPKTLKELMRAYSQNIDTSTPIRFEMKKFYPMSSKETIFNGCKAILQREKEGLFEYETDGLIFTHMFYGVGSNTIGKSGPKTKITWEYSFKWKPPQYNTIDFLVTTLKSLTGEDVIKSLYEDGISASNFVQYSDYKVIELRCGFSEKNDGFINPCQDIIDDNLPEYKPRFEEQTGKMNDYVPKRFYPTEPYNPNAGICNIMLKLDDSGARQMFTKEGEVFGDNTIVEFSYNLDAEEGWRWEPLRVRYDKTTKLLRGDREYGNSYKVCNENWKSIHPSGRITEDMLMTGDGIPEVTVSEDIYYNTPAGKMKTEALKNFHNLYVKKLLISEASKQGDTLIDFACGKAGDLPKWIAAKLSFVFGIDLSPDNLENRLDGACVRYLKSRRINKHVPYALFANGNSANNIRDGSALLNDKAKQITAAVFGNGPKEADKIGKGVAKLYGKGDGGFNVSSCQFAIHYFFKDPDILLGFLRNIAECTKLNGYFIGTSYDGKLLFNELKKIKTNDSIQIVDEGKKIWEVVKKYTSDKFEDNSSSLSYEISVYQESINQYISEYLVNYDYFDRVMDAYGFKLINRDEANEMGLPEGSGLFSELFINMLDEIKKNKFKETMFGEAPKMSSFEKKISFLNRYFIYKKVREVNVDKLRLELGEYEEAVIQREKEETKKAVVIAKEEQVKLTPKIRKLSNKIMLIPATEAVDEPTQAIEVEIAKQEKKKSKGKAKEKETKKPKKLLIIESSDEEN